MFAVFSLSACIYGGHETEQSTKWCDCVLCLSLELQQIEYALMHNVNDLYVTADRGHSNHSWSNNVISHTPTRNQPNIHSP